jgi:NDP-sugar pyrophosphorylase family protein
MAQWEFTGATRVVEGITVRQVRYTRKNREVERGDLGGWIEHEKNFQGGLVLDNSVVMHDAVISEGATLRDEAILKDNAVLKGRARVSGKAVVSDNATVRGHAQVRDYAQIYDHAVVLGSDVFEHAQVGGHAKVFNSVWVSGYALVGGRAVTDRDFDRDWIERQSDPDSIVRTDLVEYKGHQIVVDKYCKVLPIRRSECRISSSERKAISVLERRQESTLYINRDPYMLLTEKVSYVLEILGRALGHGNFDMDMDEDGLHFMSNVSLNRALGEDLVNDLLRKGFEIEEEEVEDDDNAPGPEDVLDFTSLRLSRWGN